MMKKVFIFLLSVVMITVITGCSNDDDCPAELIVDINDPESIERAEECGLSPAGPLGESLWIYEIQ